MNEELQNKLIDYLNTIEGGIEKAVDFTAEQTPQVIEELIQYTLVISCVKAGVGCLVMTAILGLFITSCVKREQWHPQDPVFLPVCVGVIGAGLLLLTFCATLSPIQVALKCWLAPRVFILEYICDLVN